MPRGVRTNCTDSAELDGSDQKIILNVPKPLLVDFDRWCKRKGFSTRTKALLHLMRESAKEQA